MALSGAGGSPPVGWGVHSLCIGYNDIFKASDLFFLIITDLNEQTCSLQLSDSVCLWQAVHRIHVRKESKDCAQYVNCLQKTGFGILFTVPLSEKNKCTQPASSRRPVSYPPMSGLTGSDVGSEELESDNDWGEVYKVAVPTRHGFNYSRQQSYKNLICFLWSHIGWMINRCFDTTDNSQKDHNFYYWKLLPRSISPL